MIAKMLYLSTETYNNEQVSNVLGRNSAKTFLKMDYFDSKSPKISKRWRLRPRIPVQV